MQCIIHTLEPKDDNVCKDCVIENLERKIIEVERLNQELHVLNKASLDKLKEIMIKLQIQMVTS